MKIFNNNKNKNNLKSLIYEELNLKQKIQSLIFSRSEIRYHWLLILSRCMDPKLKTFSQTPRTLSREKFYINWKVQWISNLYLFIYLLHSPNPSWVLGEWLKASHENMQSRSNLWGTYCNCLFTTKMKLVLSSSRIHVNMWQSVEPNLSMYYILSCQMF